MSELGKKRNTKYLLLLFKKYAPCHHYVMIPIPTGHKNTVLFITHGGLQSMVETINYGVPVVGMPVAFDQIKDIEYMKSVGMGVKLTLDNVTETSLMWSINEVLSNPKYVTAVL